MRDEEREEGAALLDVDESSRAAEEVLGAEPVPLRAVSRLATWESRNLWRLSWASILVQLFNFMLSLVTQMFVGHLGKLDLAGASITNVGIQGLAYGIMLGMASAVQTVCGQAYGAKKYRAMGIICQKALILHFGAAILLAFLYWYSGSLLRAIGQSESIAAVGQLYARGLLPQLVAFALYCPMQRFLQAQNIVNPMAYIAVAVLLFHVLISWLAVFVFRFGILGASLTLSFSWWVLVLITWLFIIFNPACKDTWTGFSSQAFKGLWSYLKLTVASAIMLVVNYWNWDFMIMLGLSNAASVRVGNELGAAHPRVARLAVIVVVATSLGISVVISVLVFVLRTPLSKLYTSSTEVIQMVVHLTPLLAISIFLNGVQPILSGVAIGSGWQAIVAYVNVGAYYFIGLPIGCVLGFKTSLGAAVDKALERLKHNADDEALAITGI
ncbi:MatE [Musa troglodytarum]|uniref:MatE n=1 Tax=Musa troglodytarum TaxID=320322 RepID=A0A9E7HWT1_9LILI|nr:MatE [Musa troglodytarum]